VTIDHLTVDLTQVDPITAEITEMVATAVVAQIRRLLEEM